MRVAVTGGQGFIGRELIDLLEDVGDEVFSLDLPNHDVRSPDFALPEGTGAVIHLAGVLGTHELFDDVDNAVATNVGGTAHVLAAAHKAGAKYVGITMPAVFPSIYTATKMGALALERAYNYNYGMRMSRVRAFNAFGPGQAVGPGHPQKIVPTFARAAWEGRPIPIWGDGRQTVDLIHVRQLAMLLYEAYQYFDENETLDGGTGIPLTVSVVAQMVLDYTGSRAGVVHLPMRRGEIPTHIVAEGEGWKRLGWRPRFNIEDLHDVIEWYRP